MATTKSTQRSEDIHGEKTSMFRRMITKLKNVPAEDDLEVVNKIKPTERVSTEPSLRDVKECTTGALQEDLQDLQNVEKRTMFRRMINKLKKGTAEDDLDDGSETNLKADGVHWCSQGKPTRPPGLVSEETKVHIPVCQEATRSN
ncbi:uncharacterized protein LOC118415208 isoform X2 [Branchiostoma floridae]|uniref:Uncharacterized protein LOC118415208 isoform X2 n=1 Tax=Branchiostoma floridae TaxID=7739 RepID=A0A9J7L424_BRAFL|nr:uncharacterized protein LOC118415208 isoform X2 [Branchiostoma floridae]